MPKLSARDQMIVAGVLIGIVAVAFIVLLIVPQFGKLSQLDADMAKAEADIAAANQLLAARQEAKQQAAQTQAQLTQLENQIPDAPEMAALIIELQDTANDAGVAWYRFQPSKPAAAAEGYQKMPLSFSVTGQWDDVNDYLRRLSELERAVRVLSVEVVPDTTSVASETVGVGRKLTANLSLEVYSLPRTGSTGAAPGAPPAAPQ